MENQYFQRTINEGSVKATHVCSFDATITLTKLVQRGTKVINSIITGTSKAGDDDMKSKEATVREELRNRLTSIRFNGKELVYEALGECFDDDEIIEVIAFINGADMSKFGGNKKTEAEEKSEALKNG